MVVMVIFLLLSILLVIFTAIYLTRKKKNINIKQNSNEYTKEKHKNKSKKQLSDILNIKIKDNIICLGNRYSIIIRLGNIDYNMLSNNEQEVVESILIQSALAIDFPIQFFSTTEYIDTSKTIALLKQNKAKSIKVQEYKNYLIEYLQNLMDNKSISIVKNYAIISYDGMYENATEELTRKSALFKANLLRTNIICETLSGNELYNLIYRELNKNSITNVSLLKEGVKNLYVGKKQKEKRNWYI